ncbi:chemotaxis protein CheA [Hahella sp. CCB-MM4]|uniref:chemotaxis protein CheA n=1 Tax=Hahella sp. (strain CCB-MM4) TaxID=1926491 RepID=UPI000B9C5BC7|nr:chemotaxis protein CheA [Hahella sp. CCB-MM4]OZG72869.1 chemotaxis protein CheA [Hahella sp. CCB-MM4]
MGFEADEEILQDFLVEAGEILEQLSEQLVELEQNPEDKDLLNAIFRGFHTVKGGAGFLQLEPLVDCCHVAENVFDLLRNGQLSVSSELMDVVLQALDAVNAMFDDVKNREEPTPADPALIHALECLVKGEPVNLGSSEDAEPEEEEAYAEDFEEESEPVTEGDITDDEFENLLNALDDGDTDSDVAEAATAGESDSDEISEDEFEALLDQLHGPGKFGGSPKGEEPPKKAGKEKKEKAAPPPEPKPSAGDSDEITDEEFESLLDELHGKGKFDGAVADSSSAPKAASTKADEKEEPASAGADAGDSDLITDDEFEKLLDDLHGKGKGPAVKGKPAEAKAKPKPAAKPAPAAKAEPAKAAPQKPAAEAAVPKKEVKPAAGAAPKEQQASIATETTVRVDTKRLDDIMNMVGELVLVRNRLKRLGEEFADENMSKAVSNLDVVTTDLQSAVMQTRMQPIKKVFGRFPRVVRDLARNLKKEVNLVLKGEDTDLDKNLVEALSDPLVHLVRNAVDHGVESPEKREQAGKPRVGRVVLAAEQEGDHILLSIEDDGAGMDPVVLRQKAVEKGLYDVDAAERLTDSEAYNLIFAPGFSTKTEISDVSGRGVGMDVVKTKISQLNGTIHIDSILGKGSRLTIKVPLTLAIMPTLMVTLGNQAFAFPLVSVVEIFHLDLTKTNIVDGQECIVVRENVYPLFHIKRWLVKGAQFEKSSKTGHVVIVSVGTKRVGLVVDQLVGQEEVVIKPLGKMLHGTPGMAGATITGDGRIALILDIPSLLGRYSKSSKVFSRPSFKDDVPDDITVANGSTTALSAG